MPYVDFEELKTRVKIEDAARMLGLTMRPSGEQLRGPCPRCKAGGDRALAITPGKGFFCWSSKTGGDVTGLVAHIENLSMNEAAVRLDNLAGNSKTVPEKAGTVPPVPKAAGFDFEAYAQKLDTEQEGLPVSPQTLRHFKAGVAKAGGNQGRLAIAVHDHSGAIVGFVGRALKDESPMLKFPNGFEPQHFIFNAHRIRKGDLYLVSDPLEVLKAAEAGIENCASFLTESISALQLQLLAALMDEKQVSSLEMY